MTENTHPAPAGALFERIRQMLSERGIYLRQHLNDHTLRLEFMDGQRIVINLDPATHKVWLAWPAGSCEFALQNNVWRTNERSELFDKLNSVIDQAIASNPLNAQAPGTGQTAPPPIHLPPSPGESHGLRNLLFLTLAVLIGFWIAQHFNNPRQMVATDSNEQGLTSKIESRVASQHCEAILPANGDIILAADSSLRIDGPNDPEIRIRNDHSYPLLLILSTPNTAIPQLSVLIHARQTTSFHLPGGQYDMMFSVGNTWCDAFTGFSDGSLLKFDKALTMQMDKPVQLAMQSSGARMSDFQVFVKTTPTEAPIAPPTYSGDGSIEVQRQSNGHFYLPGTIAGVPVTFLVDTGASLTSISSVIARQAGIHNCKEVQFQTANGSATGCIALVPNMTLGNFQLKNITVAVMPNMEANLLGANVLRNFQVSQSDSLMLIGRQ